MKRYTDAELLALLNDIESDRVERKQSFKGDTPKKARQAVCAFANDLPNYNQPGVLVIGVKDDGTPSDEPITDQLLLALADMKTDGNILPLPVLSVEKRMLKGAEMAVVTVFPSDMPPVRYGGRIWIRTGPRRSIASEQEERLLVERRRFRVLPYDLHPIPSASLEDLSRVVFEEEYLPRAIARDVLSADSRDYKEKLAACRLIVSPDDPTPTVTGLLTLGRRPQDFIPGARIQFLRIDGTEWGDEVVDELRMDGAISSQIQTLDQKLKAHNRVSVDIVSAPTEIRHYVYPIPALQQLTRNAVMHRSYKGTNAPVMVYWFNDHIEIINAGGPYGRVTPENFGKPGFADYRNPDIAESMKVLNLVQRFGVGIQMARRELADNGNPPPEFVIDTHSVICKVYPATLVEPTVSKQVTGQVEAHDEAHDEAQVAAQVTAQVTAQVAAQVGTFCQEPHSAKEIMDMLELKHWKTFQSNYLNPLLEAGFIERTIPDKPTSRLQKYRLTEKGRTVLETFS